MGAIFSLGDDPAGEIELATYQRQKSETPPPDHRVDKHLRSLTVTSKHQTGKEASHLYLLRSCSIARAYMIRMSFC